MRLVLFEELEALVGEALRLFRKLVVTSPEVGRGAVLHKSVHLPSSKSLRAFFASLSRRPAATSSSNSRSHFSASYSANHALKAASSFEESLLTAL